MKVHKPYKLIVPTDIKENLERCILLQPPTFRYKMMDFYFIIHYMLNKQLNANKEHNGFYSISTNYLKTIITRNTDNYIKYLKFGEFIISDNDARPGIKKMYYKLNPEYNLDFNQEPVLPQTILFEKIHKSQHRRKAHYNRMEPHLKAMREYFVNVEFDSMGAMKYIAGLPDKRTQFFYALQLNPFKDKRLLYFKRSKTNGRLNTNLTNLKKELRNFIIGDFVSIDLKNSQPFFLNQLITHITHNTIQQQSNSLLCDRFLKFDIVKEFGIKPIKHIFEIHQKQKKSQMVNLNAFSENVNLGILYEYWIKQSGGKYTRDQVKEIMFEVLFSRNVIYQGYQRIVPFGKSKQKFKAAFPFQAEVIEVLKNKNHKKLSIFLQRVESYIFIDCISKALVQAGIVPLTIHDSIIVESIHQNKAIEIIQKTFNNYFNVVPSFHVKKLNNHSNEYKKAV